MTLKYEIQNKRLQLDHYVVVMHMKQTVQKYHIQNFKDFIITFDRRAHIDLKVPLFGRDGISEDHWIQYSFSFISPAHLQT